MGVTIHLTEAEADALYAYTQSDACPNYWECPLEPIGSAMARWYREGAYPCWSNRDGDAGPSGWTGHENGEPPR